nr:immunoglobulin light chain junction region [Macaca mulatta]MOW02746.1 immunoglobulin light chain junction region [Macaca mulatta]MOW03064.1 immunoglobulin light chain junction region [Macaca mulatta]
DYYCQSADSSGNGLF